MVNKGLNYNWKDGRATKIDPQVVKNKEFTKRTFHLLNFYQPLKI